MSPDFNYSEVPATFLHCLNKQCKHSAKCMRYLVTAYVPDITIITKNLHGHWKT